MRLSGRVQGFGSDRLEQALFFRTCVGDQSRDTAFPYEDLLSATALTKGAADWRESESSRPETGRRVQSRCTGALSLNAESAGMVAKNRKTLQPRAQNAKRRVRNFSAFALTKEHLYSGVSHMGR